VQSVGATGLGGGGRIERVVRSTWVRVGLGGWTGLARQLGPRRVLTQEQMKIENISFYSVSIQTILVLIQSISKWNQKLKHSTYRVA
jgi:hypothetical protein